MPLSKAFAAKVFGARMVYPLSKGPQLFENMSTFCKAASLGKNALASAASVASSLLKSRTPTGNEKYNGSMNTNVSDGNTTFLVVFFEF